MIRLHCRISLLVLLSLLLAACQPIQVAKTQQPTAQSPANVILAFYKAQNAGDMDGLMALVADDAVFRHIPGAGTMLITPVQIRTFWQEQLAAQIRGTVASQTTTGNTVRFEVQLFYKEVQVATDYVVARVAGGQIKTWDFEPSLVDLPRRGLTPVNDITLYYEVHGAGEPLFLLHGGGTSGAEEWAYHIPLLAERYQVIVPDMRGHGRSTDSDQPLSYAVMADDYLKLLDKLDIAQTTIVGWSDGAIIGLELLRQHPERVHAFVGMAPNFTVDALTPNFRTWAATLSPETYPAAWAQRHYLNIAPDSAHFPILLKKLSDLWLSQPNYTAADFAGNQVPILLISGSVGDVVAPQHLAEWADTIPHATLQIVPGYGNNFPMDNPDRFVALVQDFLLQVGPGSLAVTIK